MKIRQARFSDLDRIIEIELENFSLEEAIPRSVFEAHLREIQTSFLVAEKEGRVLGYIEGPVVPHRHLQDQSFTEEVEDHSHISGGYISVTCLSIAKEAQDLGVGKRLLTALKEVAVEQEREGINLTCHDYLILYYEKHGFVNEGISQSNFAGETWYDMVWENKK
ncbi:GNAT family N-acetyltransferase [Streptococcus mitis]|jgi:acetyltransferase, GNAT family|uniref:Acetyltransferase (GNAT) family protein n=1 Tax=Streptococcus mitis TaxID=28037 RepID=A0A428CFJ6_STRMT|nr:N-acetyltransferase [Streptococcus mitis]RSI76865.1 Acetyltransferase (GNAT) family protein [Streptococcus mitis]